MSNYWKLKLNPKARLSKKVGIVLFDMEFKEYFVIVSYISNNLYGIKRAVINQDGMTVYGKMIIDSDLRGKISNGEYIKYDESARQELEELLLKVEESARHKNQSYDVPKD